MSGHRLSRRNLLRATGLGAGMLPLLTASKGTAQPSPFPRRMIFICWSNGVQGEAFWPQGSGADFTIAPTSVLAPLAPHKKDILVLDSLDNMAALKAGISTGHDSIPHTLTGAAHKYLGPNFWDIVPNAISVDQHIANVVASKPNKPRLHSLVIRAPRHNDLVSGLNLSVSGPAIGSRPNAPTQQVDPYKIYAELFNAGTLEPGPMVDDRALKKLMRERKSILDVVGRQLDTLKTRLGKEDRAAIEDHATSIRTIEQQLTQVGSAATCTRPSPLPAGLDWQTTAYNNDWNKVVKAYMDLTVAAMRCDLTRVTSMLWSNERNNGLTFPWLGGEFAVRGTRTNTAGYNSEFLHHHGIAHSGGTRKNRVDLWFHEQFAYLVNALKSVPEGTGTMLDSTVAVFGNHMSQGASHSIKRLPWVMAGSCGGYFKTGRYVKQTATRAHNGVLVALANAMLDGVQAPLTHFGNPEFQGELPGLRG